MSRTTALTAHEEDQPLADHCAHAPHRTHSPRAMSDGDASPRTHGMRAAAAGADTQHTHRATPPAASSSSSLSSSSPSSSSARSLPVAMQAPSGLASLTAPSSLSGPSTAVPAAVVRAPNPHNTEWKDVSIARFCALTVFFSTAENALFYPFYVLKTREQADATTGKSPWAQSRAHLRTLLSEQGVRGLYRGFVSSNLTAFPAYAVYMGVYSWAKDELGYQATASETGHAQISYTSMFAPFLAGLLADGASVALYVPGDVVVQRLQLRGSPYTSFIDACKQIYTQDGFQGFFRGIGATFITSGIASAVWWAIYENVKNELYVTIEQKQKLKLLSAPPTATPVTPSPSSPADSSASSTLYAQLFGVNRGPQVMAGFIAGTITSVLINPLDVIKTRLQVQDTYGKAAANAAASGAPTVAAAAPTRYRNMAHGLRQIYLDEGLRGYVRGVMPKIVSRGPLSAMSSLLYEVVMYMSKTDEAKRREREHTFQTA